MKRLKYVKLKRGEIILFPSSVKHSLFKKFEPISAGFVIINGKDVKCGGESFTLNVSSHEDDSIILHQQLFGIVK